MEYRGYLLLENARNEAKNLNSLNEYMRSEEFSKLSRERKDLYYEEVRCLNSLVQILGKQLEFEGIEFTHKEEEK